MTSKRAWEFFLYFIAFIMAVFGQFHLTSDLSPTNETSPNLHKGILSESSEVLFTETNFSVPGVVQSSVRVLNDKQYNFTTAICHKSLHGTIDLTHILNWVAYYRLLGMDHIFMWYLPNVTTLPGFQTLQELPYVTLIENDQGRLIVDPAKSKPGKPYYIIADESGKLFQFAEEKMCLNNYARDYDWVMMADADEYLWFNETIGLKEFMHQHGASRNDTHYFSFGKRHYDMANKVNRTQHGSSLVGNSSFQLEQHPFRAGYYCYYVARPRLRGDNNPFCPTWRGSSKVMVRPTHHHQVQIHGELSGPDLRDGSKGAWHFHPDEAHLKEWHALFAKLTANIREPADFVVYPPKDKVAIGYLEKGHTGIKGGGYQIYYDKNLAAWFQFVANRGRSN